MHATLDEMRAAYASFYEEAEAIASSTALASRREGYADGAAGRPPMGEAARGCRPHPARAARTGAGLRPPRAPQGHRPGALGVPDICRISRCLEGYADYDVRWAWNAQDRGPGPG